MIRFLGVDFLIFFVKFRFCFGCFICLQHTPLNVFTQPLSLAKNQKQVFKTL